MNVTIPRKDWLRGEGSTASALYRVSDGKRCCLGHVLEQLAGATSDQMAEVGTPAELLRFKVVQLQDIPEGLISDDGDYDVYPGVIHRNSDVCADAMHVNDRQDFDDARRERQVADLLATIGIQVTFEG